MKNRILFTLNKIAALLLLFGVMMADSNVDVALAMIGVGTVPNGEVSLEAWNEEEKEYEFAERR